MDSDLLRRKFILDVLVIASIVLSGFALIAILVFQQTTGPSYTSTKEALLILGFFYILYILSKKGLVILSAYLFLLFYLLITFYSAFRWGVGTPQEILTFSLIIIMSGILVNSKFSFIITSVISFFVITLLYLQTNNIISSDINIEKLMYVKTQDGIVFSITFYVIAIVSWLFNSEGEKSLKRARISEKALEKERDSLAQKVEVKTRELRLQQSEKIVQLYKFAEFGKLASGFLHDLSNSVNLVSSNLKLIEKKGNSFKNMKGMVTRAKVGTKRLESFIEATRKHVNNQEFLHNFSINDEIHQVIEILNYKAKKLHVYISFKAKRKVKTFGNSIKFHQLMSNLISNAIDAYDRSTKKNKVVNITLDIKSQKIEINVTDFGKGISKNNIKHIFEPFFTTKGFKKGTGIGLSISYDIAVKHFKGRINVISNLKKGSKFTFQFPKITKVK